MAGVVLAQVLCGASRAHAQGGCTIVVTGAGLTGRIWSIGYDLQAPPGIEFCELRVSPEPEEWPDGPVRVGRGKVVNLQYENPPAKPPTLSAVPLRAWHIGATVFTSLDEREGTEVLGSHQALGGVASLGLPIGLRGEIVFEASAPLFKQALDSFEAGSSAEHRLLRDTLFSAAIARVFRLGSRADLVPLAGGGVALVETRRLIYSLVGRAVQTDIEDHSRVGAVLTVGVDLRLRVGPRIAVVVNDRLHVLGGSDDETTSRPRVQHRPAVGMQIEFGAR